MKKQRKVEITDEPINKQAALSLTRSNRVDKIAQALHICAEKLMSYEAQEFIKRGLFDGMQIEYKISIRKMTNRPGYVTTMSCQHKSNPALLANYSELV
jgi:hypothetical protein